MNSNLPRNSNMEIGEVYFWTSTVVSWKKLFETDDYKNILLNSLKNLIERECIAVYGFVIMPNHIHLIWEMLKYNGKEMPDTSFIKFTAHQFKKELEKSNQSMLNGFKTDKNDRDYQFWQRDALAIRIFSREMLEQKLDYVHDNPMQEKWNLCQNQEDYQWSSAKFYTDRPNGFEYLTHYLDRF
jgi:putative transposase